MSEEFRRSRNVASKVRTACGFFFLLSVIGGRCAEPTFLDLAGAWQVCLQEPASNQASWRTIRLPGTLDDAGMGTPLALQPELSPQVLTRLQRKVTYIGPAWYRREIDIPASWSGRRITLELERVLWESVVWIDGHAAGRADSLSTPHRHDLGSRLAPGRHELLVRIDNSEIYSEVSLHAYAIPGDASLAHAYTNHTQVIWNGVLGSICLRAESGPAVHSLVIFPRLTPAPGLSVRARISGGLPGKLRLTLRRQGQGPALAQLRAAYGADGAIKVDWSLPAGLKLQAWDEFSPVLYEIEMGVDGGEVVHCRFGFRQLAAKDAEFQLNSRRIFLRGDLECCIFPLTGHPPTEVSAWRKLLGSAKAWGFNHIRFHSWCPPEAAFVAADELGVYLQVELPYWSRHVGGDAPSWAFEQNEAERILGEYGNHPSFMFFSLGNELQGDIGLLNGLVRRLRAADDRRLYISTTFSLEPGHGRMPESSDDYFVTQQTKDGWLRGQGIFNEQAPAFDGDYQAAAAAVTVPLVQHEVGQYSVYPDLREIPHYTGNLVPLNFIAIRNELARRGLLALAPRFTEASGRFASLLYKEEIERALRTPRIDGFQLLELQDYPGQGTALVGLLNAFWESKGFISAAEFRMWCSPVVPLARFPKAVYERGEKFKASVEVSNFFRNIPSAVIGWAVRTDSGRVLQSGRFGPLAIAAGGLSAVGDIEMPIPTEGTAAHWSLEVAIAGTSYRNRWSVWVYPRDVPAVPPCVRIAQTLPEALAALGAGERVLFTPPVGRIAGIEGRFVPVFWSPVFFSHQPGTMGLLCDPAHPALADFPTEDHSDWQWWDPALHSRSVILDGLAAVPIVRVIDNFNRNHSLANVFEARVGSGRLLFCAIDITSDLDHRPVARQLRRSLLRYAAGNRFAPAAALTAAELARMIAPAP